MNIFQPAKPAVGIDVVEVNSRVVADVEIRLTGAPEVKSLTGPMIDPFLVVATYRYEAVPGDDRWASHEWHAMNVKVHGWKVLKSAANGTRRVSGKVSHEANWYGRADMPVDDERRKTRLPDWLADLVNEARPSGHLAILGV